MSARPVRARAAPTAARRPAARVRPPAKTKRGGIGAQIGAGIGKAVSAIPISAATGRRIRNWSLGLLLTAGVAGGLMAMGLPQTIGMAAAHTIGAMGFKAEHFELVGLHHVDRDAIYRVAETEQHQDMPLVDLNTLRQSLLGLPWVEDARVSRRLPDTLVIDIVEKKPAGIWQYQQRLQLIDANGDPIAPLDSSVVPDQLPLVIGPDANRHATAFQALIATQPVLKPLIEGATWVGGRRWDLLFSSGETLSLPEGEGEARGALALFARQDATAHLLGRGIVRFDMRDPTRIVAKMSQEPGYKVPDPVAPAPTAEGDPGKTVT
jgi:cell division protein FtsQ